MPRIIAAIVMMGLTVPAIAAVAVLAPAIKLAPANTAVTSPQYQIAPPPLAITPVTGTSNPPSPATSPAPVINTVTPADCVSPGAEISVQGNYLLTPIGHNIAIDDGNGTHIVLAAVHWTDVLITATVPNDSRVLQGVTYAVGMETTPGQWLSNTDKTIKICATTSTGSAPANNTARPASGGGDLLGGALPPPPQNIQSAPIKEDVTVEPGELMVVSADMNEAQQLQQNAQSMGYGIKRRSVLGNLGLVVSVLRVPKGTAIADALNQLRQSMPNVWMDANHRYLLQSGKEVIYANQMIAWKPSGGCSAGMHIGLIDTAIDDTQPLFKGRAIVQQSFLASGIEAAPKDHGTAIASILVADAPNGLLPDVDLYAAEIFRSRNKKEVDTTAESIVKALDWLVGEKVEVINLSLGGSRNLLVEAAVQRVLERGVVIVAAAGNGGADAAPVYPAAQPGVISVTAVDANLKAYDHANRGDYIAYAAPGVDVWVAAPGNGGVYATGTSYAAPFVTAVVAASKWTKPGIDRAALDALLQSKAKDLGTPGRDKVYGWGLIQMPVECVRESRKSLAKIKKKSF